MFHVHEVTFNEAATDPVPRSDIPKGAEPCFWTAGNHLVWPDPPSSEQVKAVANLSCNGGPSPYAALDAATWGDASYPAGTFVMLDGEGRSDARIDLFVEQYRRWLSLMRMPGGPGPLYCVYAFWPACDRSMNWNWRAANDISITRGSELRAVQTARIVAKVPVILLENYPQLANDDDLCYAAWEFDVANTRRLFPLKRLYAITRNDRGSAGSTDVLTPQQTQRLALWLRSRYDGVVVWGERGPNLPLLRALVELR